MPPEPAVPDSFRNLTVVDHPLVQHKLSYLRARTTPTKEFKELVNEIAMLVTFEATRHLETEEVEVTTPLERTTCRRIKGKKLVLLPILRAGLGLVEGVLQLMPGARVGHVGVYRDEETLEPVHYYFKIPPSTAGRDFLLLDPMLATGGTASAAVSLLKERGTTQIRVLCLVAAPEGVARMLADHPDVSIVTAALDRELDENGYIRPGLGDAGDRLFGTR